MTVTFNMFGTFMKSIIMSDVNNEPNEFICSVYKASIFNFRARNNSKDTNLYVTDDSGNVSNSLTG